MSDTRGRVTVSSMLHCLELVTVSSTPTSSPSYVIDRAGTRRRYAERLQRPQQPFNMLLLFNPDEGATFSQK